MFQFILKGGLVTKKSWEYLICQCCGDHFFYLCFEPHNSNSEPIKIVHPGLFHTVKETLQFRNINEQGTPTKKRRKANSSQLIEIHFQICLNFHIFKITSRTLVWDSYCSIVFTRRIIILHSTQLHNIIFVTKIWLTYIL